MISAEDAESNARIVEALFGGMEEAVDQIAAKDPEIASHLQLDYDEDGQPTQLRFVYVDETECIGCTYCADVARNTFVMEPSAGRARAFAQGQDEPDVVMEAIECCPVNCISFVDHEDLVILETEREGECINPASIGIPATWSVSMNRPASKAKLKSSASMVCCNNWCVWLALSHPLSCSLSLSRPFLPLECTRGGRLSSVVRSPSRGCKECPMYGVGLNPIYLERMEERAAKKAASGQAAQEQFDEQVAEKLDVLFDPNAPPIERSAPPPAPVPAPLLASEDEEAWVQVECPSWVFAGEELPVNTPDGDRIEVTVPEWVAPGDAFWLALCEDGMWLPIQRDEPATTDTAAAPPPPPPVGVVEPVGIAASPPTTTPAAEGLSMPSIREMEMESFDGVVEPAAAAGAGTDVEGAAGEAVDVFGAIYANPYDDLEDELPLGLGELEEPPPM